MFSDGTKRICVAIFFSLSLGVLATENPTAKGGSLGVRTNDGRKHFTLSADAFWHLNVKERFDASALTFYKGKLLTIDDRDGGVYEISLRTNSIAEVQRTDLFARRDLARVPRNVPRDSIVKVWRWIIPGVFISPKNRSEWPTK